MEQIETIHILLGLIVVSIFVVFMRLGSILIQIKHGQRINNAYNDDHHNQRGELLQAQNVLLEELTSDIQQMKLDIEDIKQVSDVFYKYKLPNKEERDFLDQVELDNKFSDMVMGRGNGRT